MFVIWTQRKGINGALTLPEARGAPGLWWWKHLPCIQAAKDPKPQG